MSQPQLSRGAIVRSEGFFGVFWASDDDAAYAIPVVIQGAGRHRSDLRHEEVLLPRKGMLRVGAVQAVRSCITVSGRVSPSCVEAIDAALKREARARQFEDRHRASDHRETAVRM